MPNGGFGQGKRQRSLRSPVHGRRARPFQRLWPAAVRQTGRGASTLLASPELACQNPGYWLLNARVAYTTDRYTVAAWARNISDKGYYTYGLNLNAFYQDYLVRGMPRAYGVEFRLNF